MSRDLNKIAVLGANGRQGAATVDALLLKGFDVVGIVRNSANKASVESKGSKAVGIIADMDNLPSLNQAFQGCDGVYLYFPFGFDMKLLKKRLENVVSAAKEQKIKFLVYANGIVVRPGSGISFLEDALKLESQLMSDIPGCILKPSSFMDELLSGSEGLSFKVYTNVLATAFKKNVHYGHISTRDIGNVAASVFENPRQYEGKRITLATEILTGQQLTEVLSKLRQTEYSYKELPWPLFLRLFVPSLIRWIDGDDVAALEEAKANVQTIFPSAQPLEEYLRSKDFANQPLKPYPSNSCVIC